MRTVGLIAVAAVLGLVGGTAVGYGVQAEREPTPLPALNQPGLAYPKPLPKGQKPVALPASEDRRVKTDGDLRKLLVPKPAGSKEFGFGDGWLTVPEYARDFKNPGGALSNQLGMGVRRIAATSWQTGKYRTTSIVLVQYRDSDQLGAQDHAEGQMDYMPDKEFARSDGEPIKGSANGHYYVFPVDREPGYMDSYEARAYFHRGDIMVAIFINDTRKISAKDISSLAEKQLGRL
ncbi:hypothetical protein [Streptomyces sp. NPDC054975]